MPESYLPHVAALGFFALMFFSLQFTSRWLSTKEKSKHYSAFLMLSFGILTFLVIIPRRLLASWRPDLEDSARTGTLLAIFGVILWTFLSKRVFKKKA